MTSIKDFEHLRQEIINETIEERNNFYNFKNGCIIIGENEEKKFSIEIYEGEFDTFESIECQRVFSFKTEEIRDKFLEDQRELLEIAKPLL